MSASIHFSEQTAKNPNGSTRVNVSFQRSSDGAETVEITAFAGGGLGAHLDQAGARELAQDLARLASEILAAAHQVDEMRRLADKALGVMGRKSPEPTSEGR